AFDEVRLHPEPSLQYRIGWVRLIGLPAGLPDKSLTDLDDLAAVYVGRTATRELIENLTAGIAWNLRQASYEAAEILQIDETTEPEYRTVGLTVTLVPGPAVRIGGVRFVGSAKASMFAQVASEIVAEGTLYSITSTERLRTLLQRSGLFRQVRISVSDTPTSDGSSDVIVELQDRPPPDHVSLAATGFGLTISLVTMVLIIVKEVVGAAMKSTHRPTVQLLTLIVVISYAVCLSMLLNRLYQMIA
ncbi:hypothetical protein, partial [Roseibium sp.]|uniref:hypothetical protein n=1 Tax=Roseibium sp. TaxID=1936156 RepID=UPI003D124101